MDCWHLTFAASGRRTLTEGEPARRATVRAICRIARGDAPLFSVVDDHLHVVVAGDRARAGRLAGDLARGLRAVLSTEIEPARIRRVEGRSHLESLVDYVHRQGRHHGTGEDAVLGSGSSWPDIVGARVLAGFDPDRLLALLPRWRREDVLEKGRGRRSLAPPDLGRVDLGRIVGAAAFASGIGTTVGGRSPTVVAARAVVVRLARQAGYGTSAIALSMPLPVRTAQDLAHHPVDARLLQATLNRLAIEEACLRDRR